MSIFSFFRYVAVLQSELAWCASGGTNTNTNKRERTTMSGNTNNSTYKHAEVPKKIDYLAGIIKQRLKCWHIFSVAQRSPFEFNAFRPQIIC